MSKIYLQVEADINKVWNSFTDKQQKNIVDNYINGLSQDEKEELATSLINYINPDSMVKYLDNLGYKIEYK